MAVKGPGDSYYTGIEGGQWQTASSKPKDGLDSVVDALRKKALDQPLPQAEKRGHVRVINQISVKLEKKKMSLPFWVHLISVGILSVIQHCYNMPIDKRIAKFQEAAKQFTVTVNREEISRGSVNKKDKNGNTPLQNACEEGDPDKVEILLSMGAKINEKDKQGNTPLHKACMTGHAKVAKLLIDHGARVDSTNEVGRTPIQGMIDQKAPIVSPLLAVLLPHMDDGDCEECVTSKWSATETQTQAYRKFGAQFVFPSKSSDGGGGFIVRGQDRSQQLFETEIAGFTGKNPKQLAKQLSYMGFFQKDQETIFSNNAERFPLACLYLDIKINQLFTAYQTAETGKTAREKLSCKQPMSPEDLRERVKPYREHAEKIEKALASCATVFHITENKDPNHSDWQSRAFFYNLALAGCSEEDLIKIGSEKIGEVPIYQYPQARTKALEMGKKAIGEFETAIKGGEEFVAPQLSVRQVKIDLGLTN